MWPTFALKEATENFNENGTTFDEIVDWHVAFMLTQKTNTDRNVEIMSSIENYVSNVDVYNQNALVKLPKLVMNSAQLIDISSIPEDALTINPNLPVGEKLFTDAPVNNLAKYYIFDNGTQRLYFPQLEQKNVNKQEIIIGTKNRIEFTEDMRREIQNSINTASGISDKFVLSESERIDLEHAILGNILINTEQLENKIIVGSLQIFQENCKSGQLLPIEFNPEDNLFRLSEFSVDDEKSCSSYVEVECEDCSLAPIDKSTRLPSTYVPSLIATNLPGGGLLTQQTVNALRDLSNALSSNGISLYVTSGYRSYAQQQVAYNSWVTSEIKKGSSLENAKVRANNYSALPGHSEHQLGTTADVRCSGCDPFSKDLNNSPFYLYLYDHAHEFGFVISYPENKQELTGYSFEPWHIRYIGVAMATELFDRGYLENSNEEYLSKFLREKGLY